MALLSTRYALHAQTYFRRRLCYFLLFIITGSAGVASCSPDAKYVRLQYGGNLYSFERAIVETDYQDDDVRLVRLRFGDIDVVFDSDFNRPVSETTTLGGPFTSLLKAEIENYSEAQLHGETVICVSNPKLLYQCGVIKPLGSSRILIWFKNWVDESYDVKSRIDRALQEISARKVTNGKSN